MSKMKWLAALTLGLFLTASAWAAPPYKALIVDGQNNHDWKSTTPVLKKILEDTKLFTVDVATAPQNQTDYLYEPSPEAIFNQLLPRYVEVQVYKALLESNAAFFAAQMTAMDSASKNATDMIASLTLYMNKVRQAAITREIIEVVSGAQAL